MATLGLCLLSAAQKHRSAQLSPMGSATGDEGMDPKRPALYRRDKFVFQ